jgi:hypothetical protein
MDKQQAEQALAIIRGVIANTREDLVAQNWGLIWLVHAFTNGAAFAAIGLVAERNQRPIIWYLIPLAVVAVVNLVIVAALADRDRGVRSVIEYQLHGIWLTFIVFTLGIALVLHLAEASPRLFGPLIASTSGIGFAMMGVMFSKRFLILAAAFLAVAVLTPLLPPSGIAWYFIAAVWWIAMFIPGVLLTQERRRRMRDERRTQVL